MKEGGGAGVLSVGPLWLSLWGAHPWVSDAAAAPTLAAWRLSWPSKRARMRATSTVPASCMQLSSYSLAIVALEALLNVQV